MTGMPTSAQVPNLAGKRTKQHVKSRQHGSRANNPKQQHVKSREHGSRANNLITARGSTPLPADQTEIDYRLQDAISQSRRSRDQTRPNNNEIDPRRTDKHEQGNHTRRVVNSRAYLERIGRGRLLCFRSQENSFDGIGLGDWRLGTCEGRVPVYIDGEGGRGRRRPYPGTDGRVP
jgi:hypothetical protein